VGVATNDFDQQRGSGQLDAVTLGSRRALCADVSIKVISK
jgi:hypothetical protein